MVAKLVDMLEEILNSRSKVKILQLLTNRPEWIFGETEVAKELDIPKTTTHRSLKALRDQNIVREFKKGRGIVYQLNKTNYVVRELLEPLFKKENTIITEKSKEFCRKLNKLISVGILFGSAARGEMKATSDVDLALISNEPKELEKLADKLKAQFLEKDSIIFSTHIYEKKDFKKRYKRDDPLILEIINGNVVYGNIEEVI